MIETDRAPPITIRELAITTMSNGDAVLYDPEADPKPYVITTDPEAPVDLGEER